MRTTKDFQVGFRVKKKNRDEIFKQADEADYSVSEFLRTIILKHLRRVKTENLSTIRNGQFSLD